MKFLSSTQKKNLKNRWEKISKHKVTNEGSMFNLWPNHLKLEVALIGGLGVYGLVRA